MPDAEAEAGARQGLLHRFRIPLVIAAALALYALAGFLLAPWLVQRQLPILIRESIGREARVGPVEVNPFALTLRARDIEVADADGSRLAAVGEVFADLEIASLWRRALVLGELGVRAPYLKVVRERSGTVNLLELAAQAAAAPAAAPREAEPLPRIVVHALRLSEGEIDLADRVPREEFRTRIGPLAVALDEISTIPEEGGRHDISATLESGTRITVRGDLVVEPLSASGELRLDGPFLGTLHRYVKDQLAFAVASGQTRLEARFALSADPAGKLSAAVTDIGLSVKDVRLAAPQAGEFLAFSELSVVGGEVRWPESVAGARRIALAGLRLRARRERDGTLNLAALLAPKAAAGARAEPVPAEPPRPVSEPGWRVRVGEAAVVDLGLEFTDAGPATPAVVSVADLDLTLRELDNEPGARMPVDLAVVLTAGGTITGRGTVVVLPEFTLDAEVDAEGVALAQAQPWLTDVVRIAIRAGALSLDGHVTSDARETLAFDGDVRVAGLDTEDLVEKKKLLGWRELGLDDLQYALDGSRARIARVRLVEPFARIFIARDQSTNVGALLVDPPPVARADATPGPEFRARVGKVLVERGEVDFTDLSLPLPFAARVRELGGEITTIDTRSAAPSRLALEGRVDEYGFTRVEGELRVGSPTELADIGVVFRNIEMPPLSPYTVKFAGRRIARGKVDLDLRYRLDQRRMVGENRIVIDELELGEKVPHPDAVDLPLGLAVALLKDADGRIDLDMPVSGSLDDPQFAIGGVLWKAFVNLITRVATAPFRLLGGLVGAGSEDLGRIEFGPGRADLLPPEREKLASVAAALGKRPALAVEVPAVAAPEVDVGALRTQKAAALIEAGIAAAGTPQTGRSLEKRTRRVVEDLFASRFPAESLAAIQARFQAPPPEEPQARPRLDELAYLDELRARIAAAEVVTGADLDELAARRAAAIAAGITGPGQVAAERVRLRARRDVEARSGQWVAAEIGIAAVAD